LNEELLKFDGFDDAVIGVCVTWHGKMLVERIIYNGKEILKKLMSQGMTEEQASEYIDFNMLGAYVGDSTPAIMWPATAKEIDERS
jgi:hypothetical protein